MDDTDRATLAGMRASAPRVSVVVPTLDKPELTIALLDCLAAQTQPPERVFIMDNGSSDKTWRRVEKAAKLPLAIEEGEGLTIYELWNRGYWRAKQHAGGGAFHVLVVNNDVLLPPWAVEQMSQALVEGDDRAASYPNWKQPWSDAPVPPPHAGPLKVAETHGVWGSDGMLGYCFMLAGHRIDWRPLIQDLAYQWWYGDNALADSIAHAGLKQVKLLGLPIQHAHEGTARDRDLASVTERDAKLWATRRRLDQVERINRGGRVVARGTSARRDWRASRPPRPGA